MINLFESMRNSFKGFKTGCNNIAQHVKKFNSLDSRVEKM